MFEEIISKIEKHDSIVLFGHLNPDGDCYGSQVALRAILKKQFPNKKIYAVGSGLKKFYSLLGEMDDVSLETIKASLAVVLDSNDIQRLEDQRAGSALDFVKIDHHVDTLTFKEGPQVVDDKATSTSELVYDLAMEAGYEIPFVAAEALYLGVYTDTARFQYAFNYIKMFGMLKHLIELGVIPKTLTAILNTTRWQNVAIKSFIYRNIQKDEDGILYVIANNEQRKELGGVTNFDITGNTSLLQHVEGYPIWFIASETDSHGMQCEMRSNAYNVQKVAMSFGGGGHLYAAGFTIKEFSEEAVQKLIAALKQTMKDGKI